MGIWTQLCPRSYLILQADVVSLVYLAALSGLGKILNPYLFTLDAIYSQMKSYSLEMHCKLV